MELISFVKSLPNFKHGRVADKKSIELAEQELELKFSQEYIDLISEFGPVSGGYVSLTSTSGSLTQSVIDETKEIRKVYDKFPKDLYVICDLGGEGFFILQNQKGEIFIISDNDTLMKSYNSIYEWIKDFHEED